MASGETAKPAMTVEEALGVLRELFPPPKYQAEITIDTAGEVEIDVFYNGSPMDCENVLDNRGTLEECIEDARARAQEAKDWHDPEKNR